MIYKTRPGIVLLRICDVDILAATRKTWEVCPAVRPLPRMWAGCWALMEKGRTSEEVVHTFMGMFQKSEEEVRKKLDGIFSQLYCEGYLIDAEENSSDE